MLWVVGWMGEFEMSAWARAFSYLSVVTHFESFARGVLDSKDAIFYAAVIFLGLFFTARSMESLRWRS
jgi:ABC-2 type transport system permease protein